MAISEVNRIVLACTAVFLIAPAFILLYTIVYNRRKKRHIEEKALMISEFHEELVRTQLEIREQTMQTIGADLHDNIGQLLSLTAVTLSSIDHTNDLKTREKVTAAADLTTRSIQELRLLGKLLQGDQLVRLGLYDAISQAVSWLERSGKYRVTYHCDELLRGNNPDKELIIFRIFQETISNIIKHARASSIWVTLAYTDKKLQLMITDDGQGFEVPRGDAPQKGMGLQNIQKRMSYVNGTADIRSRPGEGTCVELIIPYP